MSAAFPTGGCWEHPGAPRAKPRPSHPCQKTQPPSDRPLSTRALLSQNRVEGKQGRKGGEELTDTSGLCAAPRKPSQETVPHELPRAGALPRPICPTFHARIIPSKGMRPSCSGVGEGLGGRALSGVQQPAFSCLLRTGLWVEGLHYKEPLSSRKREAATKILPSAVLKAAIKHGGAPDVVRKPGCGQAGESDQDLSQTQVTLI